MTQVDFDQAQDHLDKVDRKYGEYLDAVYDGGPVHVVIQRMDALREALTDAEAFYKRYTPA